jgi:hypothetical protein
MGRHDPSYYRRYRRTPAGHRAMALGNAKKRAGKAGVEFTLTSRTIPPCPPQCPCCGVEMRVGDEHGRSNAPSLDRLDPSRGYTAENVLWICHRCNTRKGEWTPGEMYAMADWLYELYRERGFPCETKLRPLR